MVETHGATLANLVAGLGPMVANRFFDEEGIEVADWVPLQKILALLARVGEELGDDALFKIGQSVPATGQFAEGTHTVIRALGSIDVAYHRNHRKDGVEMFTNGRLVDGIGYYICIGEGPRCCILDSASLYPCAFDLGLVTALARKHAPKAEVEHLDSARCRRRGCAACTYLVVW
jgi:hypothetical protein